MINSEVSDASYVIQGGVTSYPIGFEYHFNEQNSPQLLVKIGDREAIINVDFQLSSDNSEIILIPTEEEAKNQTSPNDTRWMERINGEELYITRNIPFKQTSDYTVGRISPEQIEYDFDRTVMRDQEILRVVKEFGVDVALAESLSNAAVETANEAVTAANAAIDSANNAVAIASETVSVASEAKEVAEQASRDAVDAMAESSNAVQIAEGARADIQDAVKEAQTAAEAAQQAAASVANKQEKLTAGTGIKIEDNVISTTDAYSKTEIDNKITVIDTAVDANTEAIQKTREDYIEADSEIHQILNSQASELTTLRGNQASLGNQVAGIEAKIPGTASGTNYLVTKQMLLEEEMDIRGDLNESVGELQTQITAQAAEIAKKQDELTPGENITIVDGVISATGGTTGDFLPLSGGLMTGPIRWDRFTSISGYSGAITINTSAAKQYNFSETGLYFTATSNRQLGVPSYPWTKIFAEQLYNGSDINIPTEGGTLARVEDLASYVTLEEFDNTISGIAIDFVQKAELEDGTTGQVLTKTDDGFEWQDASSGGASGDYLPLTGGTMTGDINFKFGSGIQYIGASKANGGVNIGLSYISGNTGYTSNWVFERFGFYATDTLEGKLIKLGQDYHPWSVAYTQKINKGNGGADLIVPTEGGTLARVEDIAAIGGDGTTGQVLTKTDGGMEWKDATGGGGGGTSLPDQAGNAGKFLQTDGTGVHWNDALTNESTNNRAIAIHGGKATGDFSVAITSYNAVGFGGQATATAAVQIGTGNATATGAIQLGSKTGGGVHTNDEPYTVKISLGSENITLLKSDGLIPAERMGAGGTEGQVLTKTADGMAWQDATGGGASGDFLPLAGGTMTGVVNFDAGNVPDSGGWDEQPLFLTVEYTQFGYKQRYGFAGSGGGILFGALNENNAMITPGFIIYEYGLLPANDNSFTIGGDGFRLSCVYTKKISTGYKSDFSGTDEIIIPEKSGTMALIEDLDERIGDISTALTAILGE